MRKLLPIVVLTAIFSWMVSCGEDEAVIAADVEIHEDSLLELRRKKAADYDIEDILSDGKLTVLLENSTVSYFIYRGKSMGYEYELLSQFAKSLGVRLEVVLIDDFNLAINKLIISEGELVGGNMNITDERMERIDFTDPILYSRQVLVQRLPEGHEKMKKEELESHLIRSPQELNGIKLHIFEQSSFNALANRVRDSFNLDFEIVYDTGYFDVESLIEKVSTGEIDYTVADENTAKVNRRFYDNIDVEFGTTSKSPIAFGVRKTSPGLKQAFNDWMEENKNTTKFRYLETKYFKIEKYSDKRTDEFSNLGGGKISPYDDLIKKYAAKGVIDWRLIAALMYQESHFNPNTKSWAGAFGLMQFMPATGASYGVYPNSPPAVQISGGVRKLKNNYKKWLEEVPDSAEALKFTIASYNAGKGHVDDARKLCEKYGLDPNKWERNVEFYLKLLSKRYFHRDEVVEFGYCRGTEPVKYVNQIMARYNTYKVAFPDE
ncbi:MAG: transporter substrate-binding domain-containing protein [Crocinitomicaceae bacterium]|nr:transporter substrate-binding domain-containing protein [Crocinitomicaceae bacterium]